MEASKKESKKNGSHDGFIWSERKPIDWLKRKPIDWLKRKPIDWLK